ncbi:MAG: glycosyltransferase [Acetatifactor muris]|nr:glycosyltransferase [Acetatifactor muris]MCM1525830.1 glycosyltransferase [Bacteroides sp.]
MNSFIKKCYTYMTDEKRIDFFRKIDGGLRKIGGSAYTKTLGQLKYKLRFSAASEVRIKGANTDGSIFESLCWKYDKEERPQKDPLVSIIVPNYNHAPFLAERLECIYNQTYQNYEVILLDDCSTDNSREILSEYAARYSYCTTTLFNKKNSGHVFMQWNKGMAAAKGELIWIAESDDYCELDFLEKMIRKFDHRSVILAFARSVFMQDGVKIWSTEEYLYDLPNLKWDKPFFMSAHDLVQNGMAIHNIIPNVSSAVFRNIHKIPEEVENICENMHLCSDWIFYLSIMKGSVVAYTNETTNYYRIHPQSTSLKVQKTGEYYSEFEQVSCFVARNYRISPDVFEQVLDNLKEHYKMNHKGADDFDVEDYYSVAKIKTYAKLRQPNAIMACYALKSGGGETYPIYLANEMACQNIAVTLLNFDLEPHDDSIAALVLSNVPAVTIRHMDYIGDILYHLGAEVIHSHHASVDYAIALWVNNNPSLGRQIITLHGMYESINAADCTRVINETIKSCHKYVYTADKNLRCFQEQKKYVPSKFVKFPNGLPKVAVSPVDRKSLGISEEDFVLVLVSRGIPEKGWYEAIEAVKIAQEKTERRIVLVIIGDGECREKLQEKAPRNVLFLGTASNIRDYFAMGDAGILPSKFQGESYPLVVIDCLMTGRPVIATDIAEVANQIRDPEGNNAGLLIPLTDWEFSIQDLADAVFRLATDDVLYENLKKRALSASKKCDISKVARDYISLYKEAVSEDFYA